MSQTKAITPQENLMISNPNELKTAIVTTENINCPELICKYRMTPQQDGSYEVWLDGLNILFGQYVPFDWSSFEEYLNSKFETPTVRVIHILEPAN